MLVRPAKGFGMVFRQANRVMAQPALSLKLFLVFWGYFLVAPPLPRRATPVSVRMRWMNP
jgi:hypothetical protein